MRVVGNGTKGLEPPSSSVIIVNFNGHEFAEQCIRSVLATDYPRFEVIVIDNASTDGSHKVLRDLMTGVPNTKLLRNRSNLGFAAANNIGYLRSKGDIVVFLNIDTRVDPKWLQELISAICSDGTIGGAQCKLLSLKEPTKVESVGNFLDFLGYVYPRKWFKRDASTNVEELVYADGAAMAFKRKALKEASLVDVPFDPDYFLYYEDTDLSWRVRLRGYKIVLVPNSVVYHYRGGVLEKGPQTSRSFLFTRNQISTLIKNYDFKNLTKWLPILVLVELIRAATLILIGRISAVGKIQAFIWCIRNLKAIYGKRLLVQYGVRLYPDSEVSKLMIKPNLPIARSSTTAYY